MNKIDYISGTNKIIEKKEKPYSLIMGTLSVLMFVAGHSRGSSIFLFIGVFIMALNFVVFSEDLLCLQLLYIPLVAVLKLSVDGASLLSYISLIGILVFLFKRRASTIEPSIILICSGLFLLILLKEFFQQFGFTMVYIKLLITMATTAIFVKEKISDVNNTQEEIRKANVFLTWGVILASVVGYFFAENPNFAKFLTIESKYIGEELVSRFCGVSADPNYYSSLVIFAIAANLFQFIYRPHISNIAYVIILLIFGILSLSKMFLILLTVTMLLFMLAWIKTRGLKSSKNVISIILIVTCMFIGLYYLLNSSTVQLIFFRMEDSGSLNEFTTGRSDTWLAYISTIWENIGYFLVGTNINSSLVGGHNAHNTILQIWWKLGIIGLLFIFMWFTTMWRKCKKRNVMGSTIMIIGCLGPTLVLDMLFFEQLFWFFAFYILCKQVLVTDKRKNPEVE